MGCSKNTGPHVFACNQQNKTCNKLSVVWACNCKFILNIPHTVLQRYTFCEFCLRTSKTKLMLSLLCWNYIANLYFCVYFNSYSLVLLFGSIHSSIHGAFCLKLCGILSWLLVSFFKLFFSMVSLLFLANLLFHSYYYCYILWSVKIMTNIRKRLLSKTAHAMSIVICHLYNYLLKFMKWIFCTFDYA